MIKAPSREIKVPKTLTTPRGFLISRTSNLNFTQLTWGSNNNCKYYNVLCLIQNHVRRRGITNLNAAAIVKVSVGLVLSIATTKVGFVYFRLAKCISIVKLTLKLFEVRQMKFHTSLWTKTMSRCSLKYLHIVTKNIFRVP